MALLDILTEKSYENDLDEESREFLKYLLEYYLGTTDMSKVTFQRAYKHPEAFALFSAIESAFDSSSKVSVWPWMIKDLAISAWSMLECCVGKEPSWDRSGNDDMLSRTFNGFLTTLRTAVKEGEVKKTGEETWFGCFKLPDWFVEKYEKEGREQRENLRKMRQQRGFRPHVVDFELEE